MTTATAVNAAEILVVDDDTLSREMLVLMVQSADL
jgi:CheY-like chemotaxis protein